MSEIRTKVVNEIADLYFARWSSGCSSEVYEALRNDGVEFAKQILKGVPELAIVDRGAELPEGVFDYEQHKRIFREAGWVKEVK